MQCITSAFCGHGRDTIPHVLIVRKCVGANQFFSSKRISLPTQPPGRHTDPQLVNPWGIAFFPGQTFWIVDNNSGFSTLYNRRGLNAGSFQVPAPVGDANPATPTGVVANVASTVST